MVEHPRTLILNGVSTMIFSKTNPPSGHYVYAYVRKDNSPYYIGKGKGKRAWSRTDRTVFPNKDHSNIVILEHNLTNVGSLAIERRMIAWYGRKDLGTGILYNKTDGGDGNCGWLPSEETKQKISNQNKGKKKFNNSQKERMSLARSGNNHWNYGKTTPSKTKTKISDSVKKHNKTRIFDYKVYTLLDLISGKTYKYTKITSLALFDSLEINPSGFKWAMKYNIDKLYKKRYTLI